MADTTALKNRIRAAIKTNDNQEITGPVLQQALLDIVDELDLNPELENEATTRGDADTRLSNLITGIKNNIDNGYVYAGIAIPTTSPVSGKVFYITTKAGLYTNFSNLSVTEGITVLKYDGLTWSKEQIIYGDGGVFDVTAQNGGITFASLKALLNSDNLSTLIPTAIRKGGMSVKFVQSSDNKYVQYRLMNQNWSITVSDWQGVDDEPTAGSNNLVKSGGVANVAVTSIPKIPILDRNVCSMGSRYSQLERLILDLEIISESNRKFAPVSYYFSESDNSFAITFYEVDDSGKYLRTSFKAFKIDFHTKERKLIYVLDKNVSVDAGAYTAKVSIAVDSSVFDEKFDAYTPSLVNESCLSEHWGIISILRKIKSNSLVINGLNDDIGIIYLYGSSKFNNLTETNRFLVYNGAETNSAGYVGYLSDYAEVKEGEKYKCFGDFRYDNWGGNIWGYSDKLGNNPVLLGHSKNGNSVIVKIPSGVNYIRMCSQKIEGQVPYIINYPSFMSYISDNIDIIKENIIAIDTRIEDELNLEKINNGNKIIYLTSDNNYGPIKNKTVNSFVIYTNSRKWSYTTPPFQPKGDKSVHIKFKLKCLTPELIEQGAAGTVALWLSDGRANYAEDKCVKVGEYNDGDEVSYSFDPAYYNVYKGWTKFGVWITISAGTSGGTIEWEVKDFKVYELENNSVNGLNGDDAKELFQDVSDRLSTVEKIKSDIEISDITLQSPSGNRFELSVQDNGTLFTIPIIPNIGAMFGNSLIGGSGFGMAAADNEHDYYYLITEAIKEINAGYTATRFSAAKTGAFEGLTSENDIDTVVSNMLNELTGEEELVSIQLGDNVNTPEKNAVFPKSSLVLCRELRKKCKKARIVWIGMWYGSTAKYQAIQNACNETGCKFISFQNILGSEANSKIGNVQKLESSTRRTISEVSEVIENSSTGGIKNITVKFSVSSVQYESTLNVTDYSLSGNVLTYTSEYNIIKSGGIASHPGNEGFRRIANKFLYEMNIVEDNEYYSEAKGNWEDVQY